MVDPLVSVVIPSYNRPERTQRAVDSVAAQTYEPIELLVVDDGSKPPLAGEISLPDNLHKTELLVHETNRGGNVARNTAIDAASGTYLAFLDSDDEWRPEKLTRQIARLNGTDTAVSYTGTEHRGENGQLIAISRATLSGDLSTHLLQKNVIGTFSSVVVPADLVDAAGYPDSKLPSYQDWDWYLRLSDHANFTPVPEPLTVKHSDSEQISDNFQQKREAAYPVLRERLRGRADSERMRRIAMSGLQFRIGYAALSNAEYGFARRFFMRSLRTNPKQWKSCAYLLLSGRHVEPFRRLKRALTT